MEIDQKQRIINCCPRLVNRKGNKEKCGKEKYSDGMCKYHYYKKRSECVYLKSYHGK